VAAKRKETPLNITRCHNSCINFTESASYTELGPPDKMIPQTLSPVESVAVRTEAST